jgi:tetratricopeptide (TPR) repeat protein
VVQGRHDEAVARMRRVRALQPLTPVANAVPGWACFHAGRLDEAADHLLEAIELDPHFAIARLWMGQVELARGRHAEAIASLERASALLEGGTIAEAALAHAQATAGATDAAEERLTRLRAVRHAGSYVPAYDLARVELALGRPAGALKELRTALAERGHSLAFLLVDPQMAALREHPETRAIARTIGLTR